MATTNNITTTYAGEFAGKYIAAALLSANSLESGLIEIRPNVKYKEVIKVLDASDLLADGSCDFDATGTVNLTERILEPKELQVNLELCKDKYRGDWEAASMGFSAHDNLPKNFSDFLIANVMGVVSESIENAVWTGAGGAGEFKGFIPQIAEDAGLPAAQEVAGTSVNAGNVIDELGKLVDAIPSKLYGRDDLYLYISQNIAGAYVRALGGFGAAGLGANGVDNKGTSWYNGGALSFDGVKIFVANGMPDNTAIATLSTNLYFGTGLMADTQMVKVLDMADLDGSQNVRFIARFTAGVNYGIISDITTYGITNAAN